MVPRASSTRAGGRDRGGKGRRLWREPLKGNTAFCMDGFNSETRKEGWMSMGGWKELVTKITAKSSIQGERMKGWPHHSGRAVGREGVERRSPVSFIIVVLSLGHVRLFATPWTAAPQASLSITNCWSLHKPMFIESVMPSNHLILCRPLLLLPSFFPSIRVFSSGSLFISGGQNVGASALVLPVNIQDWFPLGMASLISLQFEELSRVFSSTTVRKHQFFGSQPSLWSNSHIRMWLLEKP